MASREIGVICLVYFTLVFVLDTSVVGMDTKEKVIEFWFARVEVGAVVDFSGVCLDCGYGTDILLDMKESDGSQWRSGTLMKLGDGKKSDILCSFSLAQCRLNLTCFWGNGK